MAEALERDNRAIDMRVRRFTWQEIADQLGYASRGAAQRQVNRRLEERQKQMADSADTLLQQELAEIDVLAAECYRVLSTQHVQVSKGEVVRDVVGWVALKLQDSEWVAQYGDSPSDWPAHLIPPAVYDDGPVLAAVDRLTRLGERRAKLLGLDKPQQIEGGFTIKIEGLDGEQGP